MFKEGAFILACVALSTFIIYAIWHGIPHFLVLVH